MASFLKSLDLRSKKVTSVDLKNLNILVAALLAVQALVIIFISSSTVGLRPVTTAFLTNSQLASSTGSQTVMVSATHHFFDVDLTYVVAAFLLAAAVSYALMATRYNKGYESGLKNKVNFQKWVGFAVNGSLMMIAIGLLVGVYDITTLTLIAGMTTFVALFGLLLEKIKPTNWLNYWFGVVAAIIAWKIILVYVWGGLVWGSALPTYIYFVVASLLLLFGLIIANTGLQQRARGNWKDYLYGERAYIVLNFVALTALAWQIYAGTLR